MELSIPREQLQLATEDEELGATLCVPDGAAGIIVIANENGGLRLSAAGDYLPAVLRDARLATLVLHGDSSPTRGPAVDGFRTGERMTRQRVHAACEWVRHDERTRDLRLGLAGVGEHAGAVLEVAGELGQHVCALVARGVRSTVTGSLAQVSAPTLLIAGSLDDGAVEKTRAAYAALRCKKRFEIVPGATRAFDEPGTVEVVGRLVRGWFVQHVYA